MDTFCAEPDHAEWPQNPWCATCHIIGSRAADGPGDARAELW